MFASASGELKTRALQIRGDFENSALAFDAFKVLFARAVGDVFTKHDNARIARHFRIKTTVDQVDHRARISGKLNAIFCVELFRAWIDVG